MSPVSRAQMYQALQDHQNPAGQHHVPGIVLRIHMSRHILPPQKPLRGSYSCFTEKESGAQRVKQPDQAYTTHTLMEAFSALKFFPGNKSANGITCEAAELASVWH